jgi:uncharacterized protein YegP (UPF0339 family)
MHFEIDFNARRQYIWRFKADNGKIIATAGESYVHKLDCEHGINLVKGTTSVSQYDVYQDGTGQWRFRLVANNGQIIAVSSESYWNRTDCVHAAQLLVNTNGSTLVIDLTVVGVGR